MSENSPKRLEVVLWHAPDDTRVVTQIYNRLKKVSWINPWFGDENLVGGQERSRAVKQAIDRADNVVLFLSTISTTSEGFIQRDLRWVMDKALDMPEGTIFTIPVRLDDSKLPYDLEKQVPIEYYPAGKRADAYKKLLNSLKASGESVGIKTSTTSTSVQKKPKFKKKDDLEKVEKTIPTSRQTTGGGHPVYILGKMEFVKVSEGPFPMGSDLLDSLSFPDERPPLQEMIPYDYFIGRYPVTVFQYSTFVAWNQYAHEWVDDIRTKHNHPITCVSWDAAKDYCKWMNENYKKELPDNMVFRLPTEAEWEKAARGKKGLEWPWGNKFDVRKCNTRENGILGTTPVGKYSSKGGDSPYGAADMAGNVWEWTTTIFKKYPYLSSDGREIPKSGRNCVVRGGSFYDVSKYARGAYRYMDPEPILYYFQGFRLVVGPPLSLVATKLSASALT